MQSQWREGGGNCFRNHDVRFFIYFLWLTKCSQTLSHQYYIATLQASETKYSLKVVPDV